MKKTVVSDNSQTALDGTVPLLFSSRMVITSMCFFGCLITYMLRLNLGFAMVCMVEKVDSRCYNYNNTKICHHFESNISGTEDYFTNLTIDEIRNDTIDHQNFEFNWEKSLQGIILGAFFYGYIVTQIPAGWLCEKIGGKIVLGSGLGVLSFLTLIIPEASRLSPYFLIAVRIAQGMCAAVSFPAIHHLTGSWAPPNERGVHMSLAYSGMYVGTVITFPISGLLCDQGFAGGWPSVFYVTGLIGIVWTVATIFLVYDSPEKHPRISEKEKNFLSKVLDSQHSENKNESSVPWRAIFSSGPVWAITIAHLCANWGLYTLVINLPSFMDEIHKFDIKENAFLSSLPYLCALIVNLLCGKLADVIIKREKMSRTTFRKTFNTIGMLLPCICMLSLTRIERNFRYWAVGVVTVLQASSGFAYSGGFFYNHVDIAPQYAGILMGISNMFGTIPGIFSPLLVGFLTPNGTLSEWSIVFYIGMIAYAIGGFVYLVLGSGEIQSWAKSEEKQVMEMKSPNATNNNDGFIDVPLSP